MARRIIIATIAAALVMGGAIASHGTRDANAAGPTQIPGVQSGTGDAPAISPIKVPGVQLYGSTWS